MSLVRGTDDVGLDRRIAHLVITLIVAAAVCIAVCFAIIEPNGIYTR